MECEFYKKLIEELPVGYAFHKIICDEDGTPVDYEFIEVNSAFERFTGLNRNDIIGRKICEIVPDIRNDGFNWIKEYGKIAIEGGKMEFEQYSEPFHKWYRINIISPEKFHFITYFTDITKETLELNEHKILLTALNDAVFELNESYIFENTLVPHNNILFYPKHEMIGKALSDIFPEEMANRFIEVFNKAKNSKEKEKIVYLCPLEPDERWFQADIVWIAIDGKNKFIINISDITEQKHAEQELIEKTKELDRFFSVNLDLLCIADVDGNFVKVNKSWEHILGYSRDYLQKKKFLDFIHPDDVESTLMAMSQLAQKKQVLNFVNRYQCFDGTYKYIEWRSHPYGKLIYAAARDITQRHLMEEALYIEKEKLKTTLLSIGDGVISVDINQKVIFLNHVAEKLTGWSYDMAIGASFEKIFMIIHEQSREKAENPIAEVLKTGEIVELANHTALIKKDKTEISIEDSAAPIKDKQGEIQGVVLVFRDVTEKKKIRNEIEYLSYHDYLTGLYNRRFFEEELLRLDVEKNLPISVLMLDVNGLKLTNDAFGHEMGDVLLKKVAEMIQAECGANGIVARTGGDEFTVILPRTDQLQSNMISKRIINRSGEQTINSVIISIAVGYDCKTDCVQDINDIVKAAETNMYKNKIKTSKAMRNQTLQLIVDTLNQKYEKEQNHFERVSKLCRYIGLELDLSAEELKVLELAGYLHDIGKIMVPEVILNKPDELNDNEWEQITRHAESGYQILKSVEEYSSLAEYVLCHHERWDGTGYPRKLKAKHIPLLSRIISVAEAYEVMTTGRVYKKTMAEHEAVEELVKNSGKQFDPEIVTVFLHILSNPQKLS